MLGNGIGTREYLRVLSKSANVGSDAFRIHAIVVTQLLRAVYAPENDAITEGQCLWQSLLEHFPPHGIRARLQNRPQTPPRPACSRRFYRGFHRRGVMCKIIND